MTDTAQMVGAGVRSIAGYVLEGELGRGSTSVVYRTRKDGRAFALKLGPPPTNRHAEHEALRFRREAATLARLRHPALPHVVEAGEHEGRPYLVMELATGEDLASVLARGPLAEAEVVALGLRLASALVEVHRHGLVHRDIKPRNILLDERGSPKLIDFGLAGEVTARVHDGGEVVGTLLYCAPEQTGMLKRPIDGRSDLYELGAVLYECATGRPPFIATSVAELLRQHAAKVAPSARELRPELGPVLPAILGRLLAKDPDDRYQSAQGLSADLERIAELTPARPGDPIALGTHDARRAQGFEAQLVGREAEVRRLRQLWAAAAAGRGAIALVEGAPGSGKTRLCNEIARLAEADGALLLTGKCQQGEQTPLAPLREAVEDHLRRIAQLEPEARAAATAALARLAHDVAPLVKRLSPALARALGPCPNPAPLEIEQERERFYGALAELLSDLARAAQGAVLVLERRAVARRGQRRGAGPPRRAPGWHAAARAGDRARRRRAARRPARRAGRADRAGTARRGGGRAALALAARQHAARRGAGAPLGGRVGRQPVRAR